MNENLKHKIKMEIVEKGIPDFQKSIKEIIFELVKNLVEKTFTYAQISEKIGISISTVSEILKGRVPVSQGRRPAGNPAASPDFTGLYKDPIEKEKNSMLSKIATQIKSFILNPPKYLNSEKDRLRASLSSDWKEIVLIDVIILAFLLASIHQLAFVFGRGEISLVPILKAVGIDGAIWLLSRSVSKKIFGGGGNRLTAFFLWFGIAVFVVLTTAVNGLYELWDRSTPKGYVDFVIDDDPLVLFTKLSGSVFLAVIILFLTFVRAILHKNMEESIRGIEAPASVGKKKGGRK